MLSPIRQLAILARKMISLCVVAQTGVDNHIETLILAVKKTHIFEDALLMEDNIKFQYIRKRHKNID